MHSIWRCWSVVMSSNKSPRFSNNQSLGSSGDCANVGPCKMAIDITITAVNFKNLMLHPHSFPYGGLDTRSVLSMHSVRNRPIN